ncbi:MAG: alanine-tRNA synthetase second additional domain-containing protein [Clostridia bacterium]|nr:alanine-tRNA synthetase second additional domain-containing protein [Clostridia bacterium]
MSYSGRMQQSHYYSVFFAPRGRDRMYDLGMQIAQLYLSPFDKLIGIIGEAGSGKSMLIKGMFPGLELTNDDDGVNVRPLPILDISEHGFFNAHTYHLDVRFEAAFTQLGVLADAIMEAIHKGKRVIVEHFDMIYPFLNERNADLMIGVGDEIIVSRPTIFGPMPSELHDKVAKSIKYRRMAHTAEDLCEIFLPEEEYQRARHRDIKHGFLLAFDGKEPDVDLDELELKVSTAIASDLPITYVDDGHVRIGDIVHPCTGPRTHVASTGKVEEFRLLHRIVYDPIEHCWLIAGRVGPGIGGESIDDVNDFNLD